MYIESILTIFLFEAISRFIYLMYITIAQIGHTIIQPSGGFEKLIKVKSLH